MSNVIIFPQKIPIHEVEKIWLKFCSADGFGDCRVLQAVEGLYRAREIKMDHLLVMRHYGKRQLPPDPRRIKEARAFELWKESMEKLSTKLKRA